MTNTSISSRLPIALAQINVTVGDIAGNAGKIIAAAVHAAEQGAELIVTPEMALTGYPPEDLVLVPAFREACAKALSEIAHHTRALPCAIILGTLWEEAGQIYNASVLVEAGEVTLLRTKHALPNYGVFDEKRVFAEGDSGHIFTWRGITLGVLICEEVWDTALPKRLAEQGAEILLVQNASPYHLGKGRQRKDVLKRAMDATGLPILYVNLVGGQDELVFDGRSFVLHPDGFEPVRLPGFAEAVEVASFARTAQGWRADSGASQPIYDAEHTIYSALVLGLRDYVQKNNFPSVVLGLSGGIDSGLTAAIAVDALGAEKVRTVRLPSPFTSQGSMKDAEILARNLGIRMDTVPITEAMTLIEGLLAPVFGDAARDTTEENIQARLRGLLVMALSNKSGAMVLTTGNKSEMSVGYATLYGDMCGGFSVLKDVYKTTVFRLCEYRNRLDAQTIAACGFLGSAGDNIPQNMIDKPPTAELRPNQRDEDSLPPYSELDIILRGLIERRLSVHELVAEGMNEANVRRIARMVNAAEYKRRQSAPGVRITQMAFGRDRRFPITNRFVPE